MVRVFISQVDESVGRSISRRLHHAVLPSNKNDEGDDDHSKSGEGFDITGTVSPTSSILSTLIESKVTRVEMTAAPADATKQPIGKQLPLDHGVAQSGIAPKWVDKAIQVGAWWPTSTQSVVE